MHANVWHKVRIYPRYLRAQEEEQKEQSTNPYKQHCPVQHPSPLFPSLITGNDLALDLKPIILLHAFDIDVPKRSYRCQNSSASHLLIRKFVEVKGKGESGFGNYPGRSEVTRLTGGLDNRPDFGCARVRDVREFEESLPKVCDVVNGVALEEGEKGHTGRAQYRVVARCA